MLKTLKAIEERKRRKDVPQIHTQLVTPESSKTSSCDTEITLCDVPRSNGNLDLENLLLPQTSQSFSLSRSLSDYKTNRSLASPGEIRTYASNTVKQSNATIAPNDFLRIGMLGRGDVGHVYLVRKQGSSRLMAMKVLSKKDMIKRKKVDRVLMEQKILMTLNHPFLVTLYHTFQTDSHLYFCMEYCRGGEFFKGKTGFVINNMQHTKSNEPYFLRTALQAQPGKCLSEADACFYAAEVVLALEYLHLMGFIYRDLKPEIIRLPLLKPDVLLQESGHIVLSDFDLAKMDVCGHPTLQKGSKRGAYPRLNTRSCVQTLRTNSFVGTEEYIAPEIVVGQYHDSAVDWWTLGIFVYEMIYATTPFKGSSRQKTFHNILLGPLWFPRPPTIPSTSKFQPKSQAVSSNCKSFLKGLLNKDPRRRLGHRTGAGDVRAHKWFRHINFALLRNTTPPLQPKCCDYSSAALGSSMDWGYAVHGKEYWSTSDESDPFDKFCSVTLEWE